MIGLLLFAVLTQTPAQVEEDLAEHLPKQTPGSQWGVVSVLAAGASMGVGTVAPDPLVAPTTRTYFGGPLATFGLGARYGLRPRVLEHRMLMPGIALVAGASYVPLGFRPFLETRGELMSVSPGGPLQPNFVVYVGTGAGTTPLAKGRPFSIQPHVSLGIGWNWLPTGSWGSGWGNLGGGSGYGLLALPAALAIIGVVFAGRIEVRYTARPVTGPGSDFFSVMIGVGS